MALAAANLAVTVLLWVVVLQVELRAVQAPWGVPGAVVKELWGVPGQLTQVAAEAVLAITAATFRAVTGAQAALTWM